MGAERTHKKENFPNSKFHIMKNFYHICLTAHSEVLLRSEEDVALMTNLSALAAYRSGTEMLTDSQMSTHLHETVLCNDPRRFVWSQQLSITKAFNHRHGRKGKLFDGKPYVIQLQGPRHMQMALNYSLRQGMHHGQSETAFDYPWSTCNQIFQKERGVAVSSAATCRRSDVKEFMPKNADFPDTWQVDSNGILIRNCFEEIALVENWYGTARSYMYAMMRKTSEEWLQEQTRDEIEGPIVTLGLLEKGYSNEEIDAMFSQEGNSKYTQKSLSDMELCKIIDNQMLGRFKKDSVYGLSESQKQSLAAELKFDLGIKSEKQISRCLAMKYDALIPAGQFSLPSKFIGTI